VSLNFTAIDFETANNAAASPCAVGLVKVRDGRVVDDFVAVFMPPEPHNWFSEFNMKVHGIRPSDVADGPSWAEVLPLMLDFIGDDVLIAHNAPFDMGVLREAAKAVSVDLPELQYSCTLAMSRRAFPGLESHRLPAVAYRAGWEEFNHHDALADSRACAEIVIYLAGREGAGSSLQTVLDATKQKLKPLHKPAAE
jgi:DNA polymerase-3 subunit epsilon